MPELPEVQVCANQLARLCGQRIQRAEVRDPKIRLSANQLDGRRVRRVWRRAKFIVMDLDDGRHLLVHLRMTGWFEFAAPARYRFSLHTSRCKAYFVDSRRFGIVRLVHGKELQRCFAELGPEPLDGQFSLAGLRKSARPVKVALLDQRLIAGIGNMYASEALWRARINPRRLARGLTHAERGRLARSIRGVLRKAIRCGDRIFDAYDKLAVYGRARQACRRCATPIRRIVQQQRSTFYCPRCQSR